MLKGRGHLASCRNLPENRLSYESQMGTSITVYPLPTKENKISFSVYVCSIQTEVAIFLKFRFRHIYISMYIYTYKCLYWKTATVSSVFHMYIQYIYVHTGNGNRNFIFMYMLPFYKKIKRNMEDQAILLNPFTVCSSFKRKLVVYPFIE